MSAYPLEVLNMILGLGISALICGGAFLALRAYYWITFLRYRRAREGSPS